MSSKRSDNNTQTASTQRKAIHGERNGAAKLSDKEVDLLIAIHETTKPSYSKLAQLFGISKSCVHYIVIGSYRYRRD